MIPNPIYDLLPDFGPLQVNISTPKLMPLTNHDDERLRALEKKIRAIEAHDTPGLDVVDMCLVPVIP